MALEPFEFPFSLPELPVELLVLSTELLVFRLELLEAFEPTQDLPPFLLVERDGTFVLGSETERKIPSRHSPPGNSPRGGRRKYFRSRGTCSRFSSPAQLRGQILPE